MTCTSGSVKKVADKTVNAAKQIAKLEEMINGQSEAKKSEFEAKITKSFEAAKVTDGRLIKEGEDVKTEYVSEFSLDKIAAVVISTIKAAVAAKDPKVPNPAMSPEAVTAYTDVVNTVAEAAKSSSTSSASLSYTMNRLSPGIYAFLYATSVSITDEDTFGTEAVTTTSIFFQLYQSTEDVNNEMAFGAAVIDAGNLLDLKIIQAGLTDGLAKGDMTIDEWMARDASFQKAIEQIKSRIDANSTKSRKASITDSRVAEVSKANIAVVQTAMKKLSLMGDSHKIAIETTNARIASGHF